MLLRRASPLAVALAAIACEPSVPYDPSAHNPAAVDYAVFDPAPDSADQSPADIPLPNDLALQPSAIATQPAAQAEVLTSFAAQGGWPADQDLPITFDFVRISIDPATGATTRSAPDLDVSSINQGNLIILALSSAGVGVIAYDSPLYVVQGDHGTLIVNKKAGASGLRHWSPATYVAAVKGGADGIKTKGGGVINPRPAMYLMTQGVDLSRPENQALISCDPPVPCTREMKAAKGAQLETLRKLYLLPFQALEGAGFPTNQIANLTAFTVASAVRVVADPAASALPFPSDFLFKPGTHQLLDAITSPSGPFGPLGPGLKTLDGFSTTAMMTASTSGLIDPATVNKDTVFLYELGATPRRVPEAAELAAGALPGWVAASASLAKAAGLGAINVIALQPAVPIPVPGGIFPLPPLKEATEYAVVITDGVKDAGGKPIIQATLGRLLALNNPLLIGSTPTVAGLKLADAQQLEPLRLALKPVLDDLAATKKITRSHVLLAYTVRTQSITKDALTAAVAPDAPACSATVTTNCLPPSAVAALQVPVPGTTATFCNAGNCPAPAGDIGSVYDRYGADKATIPNADIGMIVESVIVTLNNLNPATGAFNDPGATPPQLPAAEPIPVLIATPKAAAMSPCTPGTVATPVCPAPLVVFRHGLGGSRGSLLLLANQFTKAGFVVAAIDAAKHGARSYCIPARDGTADAECTTSCVPDPALTSQGDTAATGTPGKCQGATPVDPKFVNRPVQCPAAGCPTAVANAGTPRASGNYLISGNLFRTRDTLRQDIIDQSQLIHVLAVNPLAPPAGHDVFNAIAATGIVIDPTRIYYVGSSLGGIQGVVDAAVNPRITKVALNSSGETIVDIFSNSPNLSPSLNALLAGLGIAPGSPAYLQFLTTAKWILDPAEPANFSGRLAANTLPNLLAAGLPPPLNSSPMVAKKVMGQMASCDTTVPNAFNLLQYLHIGLGRDASSTTNGTLTQFISPSTISASCPGGVVRHGFVGDWQTYPASTPGGSIAQQGQDDIAAFFAADVHPPLQRFAP